MRAVFVREGERLVGVVTRRTLVRDVVAAGRDPQTTPVRRDRRAAAPHARPGVAAGRGVPVPRGRGSRARPRDRGGAARRRSLEQRFAAAPGRGRATATGRGPERLRGRLAAGVGAGRCLALFGLGQLAASSAAPSRMSCSLTSRASRPKWSSASSRITAPATITGARSGSSAGIWRRSAVGTEARRSSLRGHPLARKAMAVDPVGVVLRELEIEGGNRSDRPRDADRGLGANIARHAFGEQRANSFCARRELLVRGRI